MPKAIATANAPDAIGPYSQGSEAAGIVVTSGQIPVDVATGQIPESVAEQTTVALQNVKSVLAAGGASMDNVFKVTVFIKDMNDFAVINEVYGSFFNEPYPARSCVEVARLPKDVLVEIEAMATK